MKKKLVAAAISASALGGGYYAFAPQEYVVMKKAETYADNPATVVKANRLQAWIASDDMIVEPIITFHTMEKWTCGGPCVKEGDVVNPPDPTLQPADWGVAKVKAPEAMRIQDGKSIKVCVVDTGIDRNHPDVKAVNGRNFTSGNAAAWDDDQGHGTHTAGLVSALNNSTGVVGSSQAQLFISKVLDRNGSGQNDWIANGVVWCVNAGAHIISMSLGGPTPSQALFQAMRYASSKGVRAYVAAGNDGNTRPNYPAAFNVPGLYAVSATDRGDQKASFSSFGPHIKMACPGVEIKSTCKGGGFCQMSGTSMATPICAGVGALALAAKKPLKFTSLGSAQYFGAGLPNALASVQ